MAKRNSVSSSDRDMKAQGHNSFRPAYGTAQDSDDVRIAKGTNVFLVFSRAKGLLCEPFLYQENTCMASFITFASYVIVLITFPISIWGCIKVIGVL